MSVLPPFELHRPATLEEALDVLSFDDMPLGGGTELLLAMRMRVLRPVSLVNLKGIAGLDGISVSDDQIEIGGSVTHHQAINHPEVAEHLPILPEVLEQVGNPRVRSSGTLAGNLVFAEPKSDVIPILQALDATVELRSAAATRTLTIAEFILGPYWSAREPDELLTRIVIPLGRVDRAVYEKFQTMERPTVGVAAADSVGGTRRIVIGAVAAPAIVHEFDAGEPIDGHALAADVEPVPDIAGSEQYKRHVTGVTIDRAVARLEASGS